MKKHELDNHANQLNDNNDAYYKGRGIEKPSESVETSSSYDNYDDDYFPTEEEIGGAEGPLSASEY